MPLKPLLIPVMPLVGFVAGLLVVIFILIIAIGVILYSPIIVPEWLGFLFSYREICTTGPGCVVKILSSVGSKVFIILCILFVLCGAILSAPRVVEAPLKRPARVK